MHGARAGAPKGKANGAWKHGGATDEMVAERRMLGRLINDAKYSALNMPDDGK